MSKLRGIDKDFAEAFKKSKLYTLYKDPENELIIGVRHNYLNLYYNCDSIAKIEYNKKKNIFSYQIDKYYLDGIHYKGKEKLVKIEPDVICNNYEIIKENSEKKVTSEKKAQSKLVLLNNNNESSKWFCIDIEYIKSFDSKIEKLMSDFNGRFDIIAISKTKPYQVAIIELKYGGGSLGGDSGVYKHIDDFYKFSKKGFFCQMKQEIVNIITSYKYLGIDIPFDNIEIDSINPDFYIITLDNNPEKEGGNTPKQTMAGYLFKDKRWDCKKLSTKPIESKFGDVTNKSNEPHVTFLFSKENNEKGININDIINGNYDERIVPE
jgi:hypothetical protein